MQVRFKPQSRLDNRSPGPPGGRKPDRATTPAPATGLFLVLFLTGVRSPGCSARHMALGSERIAVCQSLRKAMQRHPRRSPHGWPGACCIIADMCALHKYVNRSLDWQRHTTQSDSAGVDSGRPPTPVMKSRESVVGELPRLSEFVYGHLGWEMASPYTTAECRMSVATSCTCHRRERPRPCASQPVRDDTQNGLAVWSQPGAQNSRTVEAEVEEAWKLWMPGQAVFPKVPGL